MFTCSVGFACGSPSSRHYVAMPNHVLLLIFGLARKEHYATLLSFPFSLEPDLSPSNVCSMACAGGDSVLSRSPSLLFL
jgi:hypothetical protein